PGVTAVPVFLDQPGGCADAVNQARRLGPVTIVVHAAALGGYLGQPIWAETAQAWRATLAVDPGAAVRLTPPAPPGTITAAAGGGGGGGGGPAGGGGGGRAGPPYGGAGAGLLGRAGAAAGALGPWGVTVTTGVPGGVRAPAMADQAADREAARRGITTEQV